MLPDLHANRRQGVLFTLGHLRKSRVRRERDQVLSHLEEPDPVLRIPPQDSLQVGAREALSG
jgi:hypothetical protein